jgi:hypothetical protein
MTTIVEFLQARLADDEYGATHSGPLPVPEANFHRRTLAEVAAKRRIVHRYQVAPIDEMAPLLEDIRDLATVYTDHADYDPAWRPLDEPQGIDLRSGMGAATGGSVSG